MSDLERIVVLAGGLSPEREVSLRSGDRVRDVLAEAGIHAVVADADAALLSMLRADPPSAVFPAIHGVCGEDGAIREVLGLLGVPYVGSVASACQMAFDKPTAKALTAAAGLATPPSVTLPRETFHDLGAARGGDRPRRGRVRLRGPVHRGQDRVLRPGPAARAGRGRGGEDRDRRAYGTRPARPVQDRPHRGCRRHGLVPGGERLPGNDR